MSTRDKYTQIKNSPANNARQNEVRIAAKGNVNSGVFRCLQLFLQKESAEKEIFITATGNAIYKAFICADVVRRRIPNLYQVNALKPITFEDVYEPKEEGLNKVIVKRSVTGIEVKLTKIPTQSDKTNPGFQDVLPLSEVKETTAEDFEERARRNQGSGDRRGGDDRPRGRGRGNRRGGRGYRGGDRRVQDFDGDYRRPQRDNRDRDRDNRDDNRPRTRDYENRPPRNYNNPRGANDNRQQGNFDHRDNRDNNSKGFQKRGGRRDNN